MIGTVCAIDWRRRDDFSDEKQRHLKVLAALAVNALAVRAQRVEMEQQREEIDRLRMLFLLSTAPAAILDSEERILEC